MFAAEDAVKAVQELGVPVAYLLFTMWLLVRNERRGERNLDQERARTDAERLRAESLQTKLFDLSKAQIEAALRQEATINTYLKTTIK